jgi:hypothetical protein
MRPLLTMPPLGAMSVAGCLLCLPGLALLAVSVGRLVIDHRKRQEGLADSPRLTGSSRRRPARRPSRSKALATCVGVRGRAVAI